MDIILNNKYDHRLKFPTYEPTSTKWVINNVKKDWVCFDCGANVGYYTIMLSKCAYEGIVHSFEPTDTILLLEKNCADNDCKNVIFHNIGVGNKTGIFKENVYKFWGKNPKPEIKEYAFTKLDDFYKANSIKRIDFIKIDVDSFDYEVIEGSANLLRELSPLVLVELNHALFKRNRKPEDVVKFMKGLNYSIVKKMDENFLFKKG